MSPDVSRAGSLVYLSGAPGTGKSTLMARLTEGCARERQLKPFAHEELYEPMVPGLNRGGVLLPIGVELGQRRPGFPGTDTLGMAVSPVACRWIAERPFELVLAEGDRLANQAFLTAALDAGYQVHLVHLHADATLLGQRYLARGSRQNETWRKGRVTKAANLASWAAISRTADRPELHLWRFDTGLASPGEISAALRRAIPALRVLPALSLGEAVHPAEHCDRAGQPHLGPCVDPAVSPSGAPA
jgi:hypothetical protein